VQKIGDFQRECNSYQYRRFGRSDIGRIDPGLGTIKPLLQWLERHHRGEGSNENSGTKDALAPIVREELIKPTQNQNRETLLTEIDKGLQLKKRDSVKTGRKKRVLLRSYLSQPLVELRNNRARHEIGMGIFWVVLAAVCGGLGWVLLTILLK
jgi:hypothetical protein